MKKKVFLSIVLGASLMAAPGLVFAEENPGPSVKPDPSFKQGGKKVGAGFKEMGQASWGATKSAAGAVGRGAGKAAGAVGRGAGKAASAVGLDAAYQSASAYTSKQSGRARHHLSKQSSQKMKKQILKATKFFQVAAERTKQIDPTKKGEIKKLVENLQTAIAAFLKNLEKIESSRLSEVQF